MIQAENFATQAFEKGYRFWTGVPCSFLTPFINYVIQDRRLQYVGATSEGEAVAIATGGFLAGNKSVVICQNSGLGNMVNPLSSLNYPFQIPLLLIVTHRGAPGVHDEPQHILMGQIVEQLLDTLRIPHLPFPEEADQIPKVLHEAEVFMEREHLPFALIMKKGAVAPYPLNVEVTYQNFPTARVEGSFDLPQTPRMFRIQAIQMIKEIFGRQTALIATTGKTGRELFTLGHTPNQLYVVGGMGCAAGIGLGLCLNQESKKVVVIDGDGAILMKMGTLATIGHYHPENLVHIVLDNEAHDSTGAQFSVSGSVDLASVAAACHYRHIFRCDSEEKLKRFLSQSLQLSGPVFIHVKIAIGSSSQLGRPTLCPSEVKEHFMQWVQG